VGTSSVMSDIVVVERHRGSGSTEVVGPLALR